MLRQDKVAAGTSAHQRNQRGGLLLWPRGAGTGLAPRCRCSSKRRPKRSEQVTASLSLWAMLAFAATANPQPLPWYCDEFVASGRAQMIEARDLAGPDDLMGRTERLYRIRIHAWVRGGSGPYYVTALSTGHGQWRADRDVLFFLVPQADGSWRIRAGVPVRRPFFLGASVLPWLATACTPREQ